MSETYSVEEDLLAAIIAAVMAHKDQKDYAGIPFYHHVLRVGMAMSPDPEGMMIGFFHDICEDTPVTMEELLMTYGPNIAGPVGILTRQDGETYWDYISRVIRDSGYFPKALQVKRADLLDNLAPWRQTFPGAASLARRHEMALRQVENALVSRGLLDESERYDAVRRVPRRSDTESSVERGESALASKGISLTDVSFVINAKSIDGDQS